MNEEELEVRRMKARLEEKLNRTIYDVKVSMECKKMKCRCNDEICICICIYSPPPLLTIYPSSLQLLLLS